MVNPTVGEMLAKLQGASIDRVDNDTHMITLYIGDGSAIIIEGVHKLQNKGSGEDLQPDVLDSAIISSASQAEGTLSLQFDEIELDVPHDEDYESWHINFADGGRIICMPGGELAIWDSV